jgi:hypothetical protein
MRLNQRLINFFEAITWSSLSGIGNSRVAQLTVLMPVVGYLVLFNAEIATWLETVIPQRSKSEIPSVWDGLFEHNLSFLYFGLLTFGLAVTVFNVAAPRQVRRFPNFESYIENMMPIATPHVVGGSFTSVAYAFLKGFEGEERSPLFDARVLILPPEIVGSFHNLVESAFKEVIVMAEDHDSWEATIGQQYMTGSGYIDTGQIIEDMMGTGRAAMSFREAVLVGIVKQPKDVFYIEHSFMENSKPLRRLMVFVLFVVGLSLMAFPTFLTTMIILSSW